MNQVNQVQDYFYIRTLEIHSMYSSIRVAAQWTGHSEVFHLYSYSGIRSIERTLSFISVLETEIHSIKGELLWPIPFGIRGHWD